MYSFGFGMDDECIFSHWSDFSFGLFENSEVIFISDVGAHVMSMLCCTFVTVAYVGRSWRVLSAQCVFYSALPPFDPKIPSSRVVWGECAT